MSFIIRLLMKAKKVDMTDVLNQQFSDDLIQLLKELMV